MHTLRVIS